MKQIFGILFCFLLLGCQMPKNNTISHLNNQEVNLETLDDKVTKLLQKAEVTGMGVSILQEEKAYSSFFGLKNVEKSEKIDVKTTFFGASLSKAIFAYLVAQLVVDGSIELDKPLQSYLDFPLPELKKHHARQSFVNLENDKRYELITARMCLSHTTGFPNWRWMTKENDIIPEGRIRFLIDPSTRYYYSGEGFQLLQFVIEEITNQSLEKLAQKRIFEPLKMKTTSYVWSDRFSNHAATGYTRKGEATVFRKRSQANAAGSLITTLEDYSRFLNHLLELSKKKSTITELLFTPTVRITSKTQFGYQAWEDTLENDAIKLSYGLGFGVLDTPHGKAVFKEGNDNGFQHYFILFLEKQTGMLLMSNSNRAESVFKELLEISIGDTYTPWKWQRYIPYDIK